MLACCEAGCGFAKSEQNSYLAHCASWQHSVACAVCSKVVAVVPPPPPSRTNPPPSQKRKDRVAAAACGCGCSSLPSHAAVYCNARRLLAVAGRTRTGAVLPGSIHRASMASSTDQVEQAHGGIGTHASIHVPGADPHDAPQTYNHSHQRGSTNSICINSNLCSICNQRSKLLIYAHL